MKKLSNLYLSLSLAVCCVVCVSGAAIAADQLVYIGAPILNKAFLVDASNAFQSKTGIRVISQSKIMNKALPVLLNGKCDIVGGGRALKDDERAKGLREIPVARNILAVVVHKNNQVDNLSSQQIKDIFSGRITNWKEVGGADKNILIINNKPQTIPQKVFKRVIMADTPVHDKVLTARNPSEVVEKVAKFQHAVSYTSSALINRNPKIKSISIDGVQPLIENIDNQSYEFFINMYLYTMGEAEGNLKKLIDFVKSAEGGKFIAAGGMYPF